MKRKLIGYMDYTDPENPAIDFKSQKVDFKEAKKLFKPHERVIVTLETYYRQRTLNQNNTLHWYLDEISQETGMDMEEVKEQMAKKYLTVNVVDKNGELVCDPETGEVMTRVKSTTELNTVDFNEYTEKIRLWSNQYLNLNLPLPNEKPELKFK